MYKKIRISKGKTMDEHRFIMEQHLGRKLEKSEEVHHKDEDKSNNNIENLEVLSKSDHLKHKMAEVRSNAKLTEDEARKVKQYLLSGLSNKEICTLRAWIDLLFLK
jgi:hypothetical protein